MEGKSCMVKLRKPDAELNDINHGRSNNSFNAITDKLTMKAALFALRLNELLGGGMNK
jgi:hypothetical protein